MNAEASSLMGAGKMSSLLPETGQYSAAYERLRACVIGEADRAPSAGRRAAGLGLVVQQGVPAWIKAHAGVRSASGGSSTKQHEPRADDMEPWRLAERTRAAPFDIAPEILPLARQTDLTLLIASMVVSTQRPPRTLSTGALAARTRFPEGAACR